MVMKLRVMIFLVCVTCVSFVCLVLPACNSSLAGIAACYQNDQAIINHTAEAPYQYRILAPYVMSLVASPANYGAWFGMVLLINLVCFAVIYPSVYTWLCRWGSDKTAVGGVFLMTLLLIFSFVHQYPLSPNSNIELALICATLIQWKRYWLVVIMVIVASLNRETGVLLVAIYALLTVTNLRQPTPLVRVAILGALWAGITATLHITLGAAPHILGFMGTLQANFSDLVSGLIINALLLPLWTLAFIGYLKSPLLLKRFGWLALAYLFSALVGGLWGEMARLSLPAIPLILPFVVAEKPIHDKLSLS
jgi:hypothetical protein